MISYYDLLVLGGFSLQRWMDWLAESPRNTIGWLEMIEIGWIGRFPIAPILNNFETLLGFSCSSCACPIRCELLCICSESYLVNHCRKDPWHWVQDLFQISTWKYFLFYTSFPIMAYTFLIWYANMFCPSFDKKKIHNQIFYYFDYLLYLILHFNG